MDRVQKVDEENRVISLVVTFAPTLTVIKMPNVSFLYFLLITTKQSQFRQNI